ncbi:MAG: 8-amino-7-oxononanoate synthase [Acidobacteriota bacterium]|nr:8-amino-7-oxononanoate synthase [Acidobacteriota bacterium]
MSGGWRRRVAERCAEVAAQDRWRRPRPFDARGPAGPLTDEGRPVVAFASNDYLGLSSHPAVTAAAAAALERWGTGAGASRLVTGSRPVHHELEEALARHAGTERAVVFPTGFAANLGVLTTFGEAGVRICSDQYNHASIVDGARLARAEVAVYPHLDLGALDRLLAEAAGPALVVSDLVFSMDGDVAPVEGLADLCRRHDALLVLDEAHAVLGPDPAPSLEGVDALRVGTLSKTLGSLGGYVAGPAPFLELVENGARSYIFTTALTPPDAAAALAALEVLHGAEGGALLARLRAHVERIAPGHPSPIVPLVLGEESAALAASARLLEQGLWVPAIRPPTVAPGTARLRVTLSAAHTDEDVARLQAALSELSVPA